MKPNCNLHAIAHVLIHEAAAGKDCHPENKTKKLFHEPRHLQLLFASEDNVFKLQTGAPVDIYGQTEGH